MEKGGIENFGSLQFSRFRSGGMDSQIKPNQATAVDLQDKAGDLESSLRSVFEQDGILMSTPTGIKKKVKPFKPASKCKSVFSYDAKRFDHHEDLAERLDHESIACVVARHEPPEPKEVKIRYQAHERSPFVVSLREYSVPKDEMSETRVPVVEQVAFSRSLVVPESNPPKFSFIRSRRKLGPKLKAEQVNRPGTAAGLLSLRLWKHRAKLLGLSVLGAKASHKLKQAEQEFEEVAEEVAQEKFSFVRAGLGFLALALVVTLPAQAVVAYRNVSREKVELEDQGKQAVAALAGLDQDASLEISVGKLQEASGKFREADRLLDESRLLAIGAAAVVPSQYKSARSLIEVGNKMSQAGQLLALGFGKVFEDPERSLIERLEVMSTYAKSTLPLLAQAEQASESIDQKSIPEDQRENAKSIPDKIRQAKESVREFAVLSDALVGFLGKERQRTYLLVFQNQTELRPSGGFMGSVAEITVDQGKITSVYVPKGGTYDLKGQLTARVKSPKPLWLINPLWQFQDANWFADFPKTAEKIRWFWSKSGQPTVDGVIAVNSSFMDKVLAVTGPIDMPEYGKTITAENFLLETQKAVEIEYDKEANTPKKFIGDLFAKLMERAKNLTPEQWVALSTASSVALDTKEIQIAMFDAEENQLAERFGWQGRLKPTNGDSLAIVAANIAGQKTDAVIDENVEMRTEVSNSGDITDSIKMVRTHKGVKGEMFRGVRNVQYVRFYVPKGSELLEANGFTPPPEKLFKEPLDTDGADPQILAIEQSAKSGMGTLVVAEEDDRTVFGGWLQLDPGNTQEISLKYRLPFTVYDIRNKIQESTDDSSSSDGRASYLALLTSQSGKSRQFAHTLVLDNVWEAVWARKPGGLRDASSPSPADLGWQGALDRDQAIAVLLKLKSDGNSQKE